MTATAERPAGTRRVHRAWLVAAVTMGALIAAAGFRSSTGALLSAGFLLYVTSWIFRNSKMDDAVGDALAMLVQLRNLFMFLLNFMGQRE